MRREFARQEFRRGRVIDLPRKFCRDEPEGFESEVVARTQSFTGADFVLLSPNPHSKGEGGKRDAT